MAEFRKREDINQELDILQHWSEMGAPRMGDVSRSLQSLVKSVDPRLMGEMEPRDLEMTVSSEPPEFANLPPGEEEEEEERPRRRWLVPLIAALLVAGAGALALLSRWDALTGPAPSPEPTDEDMTAIPPEATRAPSPAPTMQPSVMTTPSPEPTPTEAPTPTPEPSVAHTPAAEGTPPLHPTTPGAAPTAAVPEPHHAVAPTPAVPVSPQVPQVQETPPAPARTHVVRRGESLSGIAAREYGSPELWTEIYAANRDQVVVPDVIEPGMELRIPARGQVQPEAQPVRPASRSTYTVRPGDSLSGIAARQLGSPDRWRELYELNRDRVPSPSLVYPGTVLRLPGAGRAPAPTAAAQPGPALKGVETFVYVVQPGDSLSLIALRHLGSAQRWPEIYYLNTHQIANPHWIFPGQRLAVPKVAGRVVTRYVVKTGDTLWAIAAKTMQDPTAWPVIYRANVGQIRNPHLIYPGQSFEVPR